MVALVAAADAHEPELRILRGELFHEDVCVHESVRRNLFNHY
ncbi:hypothetical protein SRABI128_06053 [Microbacterium sp. Bi128]|nr:hypothetical protein SRABI128_06053 [Microbacterium sp. Bi128]